MIWAPSNWKVMQQTKPLLGMIGKIFTMVATVPTSILGFFPIRHLYPYLLVVEKIFKTYQNGLTKMVLYQIKMT
ncbi:hypothetical protein EBM76_16230 [Vibrio parahaemolyticus]|nr:hypothetical protein [Vibrio parahaemolyticus]